MKAGLVAVVCLAACGRHDFEPLDASIDASPPTSNIAFVTSTKHSPMEIGADLSGANAICNARAAEAHLPGEYVAWLSTSTRPARNLIAGSRGWKRTDGRPFTDRIEDVLAGVVYYPLAVDEHGELTSNLDPVFTGTGQDGNIGADCADYSDPSGLIYVGSTAGTTISWMSDNTAPCTQLGRLYCLGIGSSQPLVVEPATGRRAFVTVQQYVPDAAGIATADALCDSEAKLAGLSGTFRALLATTTASAISRFSLSGPTWIRLDGIPLADTALAVANGQLRTSINVTSTRAYAIGTTYTGAPTMTVPSMDFTDSCADWSGAGGTARVGAVNRIDSGFFQYTTGASCSGQRLYCLEQ